MKTAPLSSQHVSLILNDTKILQDINCKFYDGQFCVIAGPNGAGKSSFLKMLSGQLRPTKGSIYYGIDATHTLNEIKLAQMRVVLSQHTHQIFPYKVHEIVSMGIENLGLNISNAQKFIMLEAALKQADMIHLSMRNILTLSGGEQQRCQLARCFLQINANEILVPHKKSLFFLDEPTSSLDISHQINLLESLKSLSRSGHGIIAILHDIRLARHYADRFMLINNGKLFADGEPSQVLSKENIAEVFKIEGKYFNFLN